MARSKHTDPKAVRAARRMASPRAARGADDPSRGRTSGVTRPTAGESGGKEPSLAVVWAQPRVVVRRPRAGFHHPAGKRDVLATLRAVGPVGFYGLRLIELGRLPEAAQASSVVFGRYRVPGQIILFEQARPPWRLSGRLKAGVACRLERAGAVVTSVAGIGGTLVDWPGDTLRRFVLEDVLLHELGHHVLQHYKGKRTARIARTRDHEAFAARFAAKQRAALRKGLSL